MIEATNSTGGQDEIDCKDMNVETSIDIQPTETCDIFSGHFFDTAAIPD